MAQTLVNIRMDEELKRNMEQICQEHLRRGVEALNAGKGVEHDIIEVDE